MVAKSPGWVTMTVTSLAYATTGASAYFGLVWCPAGCLLECEEGGAGKGHIVPYLMDNLGWTALWMSLPFYPLRAYPFFEMFIVYQYGVDLPSDSCSLQVGILYSNAYRNSVMVREGGSNNIYSHFFAVFPRLCRNGQVSWLHGGSSMSM